MAGYDYFNAASADPFRFSRTPVAALPRIQSGPQVNNSGQPVGGTAAKGDWFDEFMTKQQEQYDKAYNLNQQRYDEGRRLLGLDGGLANGNLGYGGTAAGATPINAVMGKPSNPVWEQLGLANAELKNLQDKKYILQRAATTGLGTNEAAAAGLVAGETLASIDAKIKAAQARAAPLVEGARAAARDPRAMNTMPTAGGAAAPAANLPAGTSLGGNAGNPGVGVSTTTGTPAAGPAYAAQTAPVFQGQIDRGIYNSTAGLNQAGVTNSLALSDAARQDQQMQMQLDDRTYRNQQSELDRNERLKAQQLQWIQGANDTYPDQSLLYEVAKMRGQGSQQNIMPESYLGGGGGGASFGNAASMGYNVPMASYGYPMPQMYYQNQGSSAPRQAAKLANLKQNNQQFKQPYLNVPGVTYGVDYNPRSVKNFSGLV